MSHSIWNAEHRRLHGTHHPYELSSRSASMSRKHNRWLCYFFWIREHKQEVWSVSTQSSHIFRSWEVHLFSGLCNWSLYTWKPLQRSSPVCTQYLTRLTQRRFLLVSFIALLFLSFSDFGAECLACKEFWELEGM